MKLRLILRAESIERTSKPAGKQNGILGRPAIALLRALLYTFHNAATGRTDPSYDRLQEVTGYCRATIAKAIAALERAGIIRVIRRMIRVATPEGVRFRQLSNAYGFVAGQALSPMSANADRREFTPSTGTNSSSNHIEDNGLQSAITRLAEAFRRRKERNNIAPISLAITR